MLQPGVVASVYADANLSGWGDMAGGSLGASTRSTLNLLLLVRASVSAFTLKICHAPISGRIRVLDDPVAWRRQRRRSVGRTSPWRIPPRSHAMTACDCRNSPPRCRR